MATKRTSEGIEPDIPDEAWAGQGFTVVRYSADFTKAVVKIYRAGPVAHAKTPKKAKTEELHAEFGEDIDDDILKTKRIVKDDKEVVLDASVDEV